VVVSVQPDHEVLIVGAGFGGIGAAIALQKAGVDDVVLVDKWHGVGGTWLANTYPGVAVDVPAFVYSFSYEQRSDWSRLFAPGEEIREYAESVVDRHGLRPKLRLSTTILRCDFDTDHDMWRVQTDNGDTITARFLVPAIGGLERPKLPDIDGIDDFAGTLMHTAMWDHDVDLTGRRVAVIGTGATSLQLVPEIAKEVSHLDVYQRTPIWVGPKVDFEMGPLARFVMANPLVRSSLRAGGTLAAEAGLGGLMALPSFVGDRVRSVAEGRLRSWMRSQVDDPAVREQLIPQYGLGCKRPSMSNTYLRTFNRTHVDLVTDPIERITSDAIVTADGVEHATDVLICATGFSVMAQGMSPPFPVVGANGVDLRDHWHEHRYHSYQGVSVPGYPNLLMVTGPNGFVIGSYFWMVEATSAHLARVIATARRRGSTYVEIRQRAHDEYAERCDRRARRSLLFTDACDGANTYYINYQGDASVLRPSTHGEMWLENRLFPLSNYRYRKPSTVEAQPVSAGRRAQGANR
jgi:cation diffusion facilitator CzcD-associated flavoprotein CzcO